MNNTPWDHVMATIEIVRACGPVGRDEIAREIRNQAVNGTPDNCHKLADVAIKRGLEAGWLTRYEGMEDAYVMRHG